MSLVLIVHNDELGFVCSDGRLSRLEDGKRVIVSDSCPKFVVLRNDLLILATGRSDIADRVCSLASNYVHHTAATFSGLEHFLAQAVPGAYQNYPIKGADVVLAVAVVGFDAKRNRVRCVSWISAEKFSRFEGNEGSVKTYAFGDSEVKDKAMELMRMKLTPLLRNHNSTPNEYFAALSEIIERLAKAHDGIGGKTYMHLVSRPDLVHGF